MWKIVIEIENKEVNDRSNVFQTLEVENIKVSKWEKANKICKFFIDIGKRDTSNITEAEKFCSILYNDKTMCICIRPQ